MASFRISSVAFALEIVFWVPERASITQIYTASPRTLTLKLRPASRKLISFNASRSRVNPSELKDACVFCVFSCS